MALNIMALLVLCLLAGLAVFAFIKLATWPKRAALARNSPYVDSIHYTDNTKPVRVIRKIILRMTSLMHRLG